MEVILTFFFSALSAIGALLADIPVVVWGPAVGAAIAVFGVGFNNYLQSKQSSRVRQFDLHRDALFGIADFLASENKRFASLFDTRGQPGKTGREQFDDLATGSKVIKGLAIATIPTIESVIKYLDFHDESYISIAKLRVRFDVVAGKLQYMFEEHRGHIDRISRFLEKDVIDKEKFASFEAARDELSGEIARLAPIKASMEASISSSFRDLFARLEEQLAGVQVAIRQELALASSTQLSLQADVSKFKALISDRSKRHTVRHQELLTWLEANKDELFRDP